VTTAAILTLVLSGCGGEPASPSPIPSSPTPADAPPTATMAVGASTYPGEVGSYSLPGGGSDGPWLGARSLDTTVIASIDDVLVVALADATIDRWSAVYAAAADQRPTMPSLLAASQLARGSSEIEIPAPPAGDWVVMVGLEYATGGSGAYYWHVAVTP
jgi:hypothetical protein